MSRIPNHESDQSIPNLSAFIWNISLVIVKVIRCACALGPKQASALCLCIFLNLFKSTAYNSFLCATYTMGKKHKPKKHKSKGYDEEYEGNFVKIS